MPGFKVGQQILSSKPYAYVLNNVLRGKRCDYCFKKNEVLKKCSRCTFVYFCDRTCQVNGWELHKLECKLILRAHPKEPTATMRLITLILLKIKKFGEEDPCEEVYDRKVSFKTLKSHAEDIEENLKSCQQIMALIGTLRSYVKNNVPLPSQFMEIYGKMCINSFSICDSEMQSIGTGLYLGASVFDHSCNPDAEVVFDGIKLTVRAVKEISHRNVNKIYISYIDQLDLTKDRQNSLKEQYYFTCKCERCSSSDYDDLMSQKVASGEDIQEKIVKLKEGLKKLKEMKSDIKIGPSALYTACLEELGAQEGVLGDTHIVKVKTLEVAFDACIENNQWADANAFGKQLLKQYRLYYGPYHPQLGICYFKVGKIETFLNLTTSFGTLKEAENIIRVTHGESHPLYKDLKKLMHEAEISEHLSNLATDS